MASGTRRVYLDYNATSPLLPPAREALLRALDVFGNPSSVHEEGQAARRVIEDARRSVAALVGASAENVVFTGSATEAAATCLTPHWLRDGAPITVDALAVLDSDHPAMRDGGRFEPAAVTRLSVDADGIIDFRSLDAWLAGLADGRSAMLAVCLANGETGVVQPIDRIRAHLQDRDVLLVLDVVQAAGRRQLDIRALDADALILSGHKIGAAKGVGAFVLADERSRPFRLIPGGGQESGLRSGTEAVPAIASFGIAAGIALERAQSGSMALRDLRDRFVEQLKADGCIFKLLGEGAERLNNTLAITAPSLKAETAQIALDLQGFAISAGSACSSGKVGPSHVLQAMAEGGLPVDPTLGLLRISLGNETSEIEVDAVATALSKMIRRSQETTSSRQAAKTACAGGRVEP